MKILVVGVAMLAVLSGCGGNRMAQPVAMLKPADQQMSCQMMQAEMLTNQNEIQTRYSEIDRAQDERTRNMFFGGLIGYATSEDGSAARAEIGALQSRNTNLMLLMQQKGCWAGGGTVPAQAFSPSQSAVPAAAPAAPDPEQDVICREDGFEMARTRAKCLANGGTIVGG